MITVILCLIVAILAGVITQQGFDLHKSRKNDTPRSKKTGRFVKRCCK